MKSSAFLLILTERKIRMKFKKITSAVLAAAMLVPSTCIVSYAEQDQAMKQALTYVKERITVPKELSHFNYSSRVVAGKTQYTFTWDTVANNDKWQSISVSIRGKVITSYSHNSWDDYSSDEYTFAKLDPDEIVKKAKEAVQTLNPTVCDYIEVDDTPRIYLWGDDARVTIRRVKDGVSVKGATGSVTIDKDTGEVLNYSCWNGYTGDTKLTSEKKAKNLVTSYFSKIVGNRASEFPIENAVINYGYDEVPAETENSENTTVPKMYTVNAYINRYANAIRCDSENVDITVDRNGKVADFNITYYGIEYPAPKNIISTEDAYKKYFEQVDYALRFRCALKDNKKVVTAMVYASDDRLNIDAFSGDLVNYNGGELYRAAKTGEYTDLEGSKYKEIAEKLAIYGVTLMDENGRLNADKVITRAEFRDLASSIGSYGSVSDKPDSALTRQFAAKMLTSRYLDENVASLPIFKTSYRDVKEGNKYAGYIAVADALGFMSGKDGKFNPSAKITRGQALQLIYNILAK